MWYEIGVLAIVAITFSLLFGFRKKINNKLMIIIIRSLAVGLFVLVNIRAFWNDNFVWVINGGTYNQTYYETHDYLQSILRWALMLGYIAIPCAAFTKTRTIKNFAIYFSFPVALISLFFYNDFLAYFTTNSGRAIWVSAGVRHFEFCFEMVLCLLVPLLFRFVEGHKFNVKDKQEWANFFFLLPLAIITVIPVTTPQSILGFSNKFMVPFTTPHFIWLGLILLIYAGLYFGFRFKNKETRYSLCLFLSLYLFLHYNQIYLMDFNMKRMPFQLCNLGAYLILLAIIIKKQSFFDFVLIANVAGALIALMVPDVKEGMLSYWNIHFYIEHMWVFLIPLLEVSLRIFNRPGKNAVLHFFVGFTIYFLVCALGGIIANCVLYKPFDSFFNRVNYFYLFDNLVLTILPFLNFSMKWTVTWNGYTFFPMYMLSIYVLFSIFCLVCYYIFIQLCKVGDNHFKVRQMRIDLKIKQGKYKNHIPPKEYAMED